MSYYGTPEANDEQQKALDWISALANADDLYVVEDGDSLHVTTEHGIGALVSKAGAISPDAPRLGVNWRNGVVVRGLVPSRR